MLSTADGIENQASYNGDEQMCRRRVSFMHTMPPTLSVSPGVYFSLESASKRVPLQNSCALEGQEQSIALLRLVVSADPGIVLGFEEVMKLLVACQRSTYSDVMDP